MRVFLGVLLLLGEAVSGQYRVTLRITNEDTRLPIVGASVMVKGLNKGGVSDSAGFVALEGICAGNHVLQVSCSGYAGKEIKMMALLRGIDTVAVTLEPDVEMLGDVVVSSSRINGRIRDLPTRVEVLGTEDMEEETSMHPSNVAMLLSEAPSGLGLTRSQTANVRSVSFRTRRRRTGRS